MPRIGVHPSQPFIRRPSPLVPSSGTRITQPFRPWDHDSLSLSAPPSLRHFPTFRAAALRVYTYVCMCAPPLCSSLSLAVSVGRAAGAFHSSFSPFLSALHVLRRLVPTILEYVRYARALACFVDRGHTGRIRERKEFF